MGSLKYKEKLKKRKAREKPIFSYKKVFHWNRLCVNLSRMSIKKWPTCTGYHIWTNCIWVKGAVTSFRTWLYFGNVFAFVLYVVLLFFKFICGLTHSWALLTKFPIIYTVPLCYLGTWKYIHMHSYTDHNFGWNNTSFHIRLLHFKKSNPTLHRIIFEFQSKFAAFFR